MGTTTLRIVLPASWACPKAEAIQVQSNRYLRRPTTVVDFGTRLQCRTHLSRASSSVIGNVEIPGTCQLRRRRKFFSSHGPAKWVCSVVDSVEQGEVRLEERDAQCELVEPLRQLVEQRGGDVESADDRELLRFLRSRSMDMDKAAAAFVSHQKWRSEYVPKGRFTEADLPTELDAKKSYWIEQDKKGRPVLLTLGRNHVYNKQDPGEFTRFLVYALDKAIAGAPPNTHNFLTVVDLKGIGVKNLDSKSLLVAFEVLQNHYPDRIDKIFMVNAPLIFNGLWKVVSKLIDEGTKKKIIFLNNKNLTETLLKEIDAEFLPKDYGGNADLLLLQDAIVSKGPDAPLETADQSSYL
ncbi:hypothetical protein MPTK1_3g02130 [Marchantia polymorpha subsp. ruderalis]|uniref:CRAL-TRIO domain-containing protein n=2 Tax=Marchantia polymorpha TaxID=3197 RepID=A0AAF6AWI7_MARPO|nr:hypothetical protein MARPO_0007s0202 [Marchantia polymorpha]BBN04121.1 hypothetical protein Mp_3g02130 [Marchantia polymorpha subsp. ruderalis]|eukprot:PTQ47808.1 hypothetical protein MARPO_0007s0202 [Marchantia polymorpha]